jgi:protein-S-isoprenylcysteine O-methyltransferase Ste14
MYIPARLEHSVPRALHALFDGVQAAAGMSGVFLTQLTPLRIGVSLTVLLFATLSLGRGVEETAGSALLAFAAASIARHVFAFASFTDNGIAPALKRRLGSELGFSIYEAVLTLLIFAQRLSFVRLLFATAHDPTDDLGEALMWSGAAFCAVGACTSIWATRVIGLDAYYYRDLYSGPRHVSFAYRGPYAIVTNPLYGVGQLAAYGAALMLLSPIGLLAATAHQLALYAFNAAIEQPHLRTASRISIDSALRETLSSTMRDSPRRWDSWVK